MQNVADFRVRVFLRPQKVTGYQKFGLNFWKTSMRMSKQRATQRSNGI